MTREELEALLLQNAGDDAILLLTDVTEDEIAEEWEK